MIDLLPFSVKCEHCWGEGKSYYQNGHNGNIEWEDKPCPVCKGSKTSTKLLKQRDKMLRYIALAENIATWSKDPSTKCGAILVRENGSIASMGYNGFPQGMRDDPNLYADREKKYSRIIHAEMNALMFCLDPLPLRGHTLYTTVAPCDRCAAHMVQAGLRKFVFKMPSKEQMKRWNSEVALEYLREGRGEVIVV